MGIDADVRYRGAPGARAPLQVVDSCIRPSRQRLRIDGRPPRTSSPAAAACTASARPTTTLPLNSRHRYLRIRIGNGDDEPLRDLRVTLRAYPDYILLAAALRAALPRALRRPSRAAGLRLRRANPTSRIARGGRKPTEARERRLRSRLPTHAAPFAEGASPADPGRPGAGGGCAGPRPASSPSGAAPPSRGRATPQARAALVRSSRTRLQSAQTCCSTSYGIPAC